MGKSSKSVTLGYYYKSCMLMSLGLPFINKILEIRFDDKPVWKGDIDQAGTLMMADYDLFGGDDGQGGIAGVADFMPGGDTQPINPFLEYFIDQEYGENLTSAYRNFSCLFFRGVVSGQYVSEEDLQNVPWVWTQGAYFSDGETSQQINGPITPQTVGQTAFDKIFLLNSSGDDGFYWTGISKTYKAPSILTESDHEYMTWEPSLRIIDGEMNPAHITYTVLTNPQIAQPFPLGLINEESWRRSAQTLFDEGFGMSLGWESETTRKEFLEEIQDTVNGNIVENRRTGQLHFNLVRRVEDASGLPVFDSSNSRLQKKSRSTLSKLYNEVTIRYKNLETRKVTSITGHNTASIDSTGVSSPVTMDFLGVTKPELASRILQRELQFNSKRLGLYEIINTDRSAFDVYTGDAVILNFPERGLENIIVRVASVRIPADGNPDIYVDLIDDVFDFPDQGYTAPPVVLEPASNLPPVEPTVFKIDELNYYEMTTTFPEVVQQTWDEMTTFVNVKAERPSRNSTDLLLYDDDLKDYVAQDEFTVRLLLDGEISKQDSGNAQNEITVNFSTPFASSITGISNIGLAYIGDEQIYITALDVGSREMTFVRAVNDTLPLDHINGAEIWLHIAGDRSTVDQEERTAGETVNYLLATRNSKGVTPLTDLTPVSFDTVGRYGKPYPPGNVEINGEIFPEYFQGDLDLSWSHRDKTLQLAPRPNSWFEGNIGSQVGVEYSLTVTGDGSAAPEIIETTNSFLWDQVQDRVNKNATHSFRTGAYTVAGGVENAVAMSNTQITLDIKSRYTANGVESLYTFTHTVLRKGYGYAYGVY